MRPPSIVEFLKTDPTERFDILALNALRFPDLVAAAQGDIGLLAMIGQRAESLMTRIKSELDDPLSAGAFLRDQVLHWYRESGVDPEWTTRMSPRLAGLFAESRISGGRLAPWLNLRLWSLRERAVRAGPLRQKVRRGLSRDRAIEAAIGRSASQQIHAEVAQAILDELSTHPRSPDNPLPLVRLSELAVRRQMATVNDALGLLFSGPESGPFVILHPNRYPDCDELVIRPPSAGASRRCVGLQPGIRPNPPQTLPSGAEGGGIRRGVGASRPRRPSRGGGRRRARCGDDLGGGDREWVILEPGRGGSPARAASTGPAAQGVPPAARVHRPSGPPPGRRRLPQGVPRRPVERATFGTPPPGYPPPEGRHRSGSFDRSRVPGG